MDALGAIQGLSALQARFDQSSAIQPLFDTETLLAMAHELNGNDSHCSPPSSTCAASENASARLLEYRGSMVAGFDLRGKEMICLPQVYELFLKNMVGGLHTVYTKLKRLEIAPIICNVEQVRALRGLGAIQPGVNRCKLIATEDFDRLYEDCTNTCTRPGRPPKRMSSTIDDWAGLKRDNKYSLNNDDLTSPQCGAPLMLGNLLPQFGANPFLIQQMLALAAAHKNHAAPPSICTSSADGGDELSADALAGSAESSVTPLNLSKSNENSETGDSDSMENMRKVDASLSPSQFNERGGSSSGSNGSTNSPSSEQAVNKIMSMIDMASEHFKQQREALLKDKEELDTLRNSMRTSRADEERLRHQLEMEKRKSSVYFRRYCKARREALDWKEQVIHLKETAVSVKSLQQTMSE